MARLSLALILLYITSAPYQYVQAANKPPHLDHEQVDFLDFCSDLFLWTAKFAAKLKSPDEQAAAIYPRLTSRELANFNAFLEGKRKTLYAINQNDQIHRSFGIPLIPDELFEFIRGVFSIDKPFATINPQVLKYHLMGGSFNFGVNGKQQIEGFYDIIRAFDLKKWFPIANFLRKFRDTLSVDRQLSQSIGFTILPMFDYYYDYMDPMNRLSILREVLRQQRYILVNSKNALSHNLTIQVFQNSGPVFIKLLQQLQEELRGSGPLSSILAGLKHSKPINPIVVERRLMSHLNIFQRNRDDLGFSFKRKPLGIASIAQTHSFTYHNQQYVVKYLKTKIRDKFEREITSIHKMVSEEPIFDKGMKQYISHIERGIREELDFRFERTNIKLGTKAYQNYAKGITTIENALNTDSVKNEKGTDDLSDLLFMTFAKGKPVGHHMAQNDSQVLLQLYNGVLNLYQVFLESALSPSIRLNFYHGDLHRENIFFDEDEQIVTVIDFGNAGLISRFTQKMLIKIFQFVDATNTEDEAKLDHAISMLSQTLKSFIEASNRDEIDGDSAYRDIFFGVCFNPKTTMPDKRNASRFLLGQKEILLDEYESAEIKLKPAIRDQIDFINALSSNCLSGPKSTLLSSLASQNSTSQKLQVVFQEMLKNGISIPRELIFFNKSKALLEGILHNLSTKIYARHPNQSLVDVATTFHAMIKQLEETKAN